MCTTGQSRAEGDLQAWFDGLHEADRVEVMQLSAELPRWMACSLREAGIAMPRPFVAGDDEWSGYRMPPRLATLVAQHS